MTVFIYTLKEPDTGDIRYVGKTKRPNTRLNEHIALRDGTHRAHWIQSLQTRGLRPAFEILDEVPEGEWQQWEVAWIEFFREQGCLLTNSTSGGEGGHNPSPDTRAKQSAARKNPNHPCFGDKHPMFGKPRPAETRAKLSAANLGKKLPPEQCAKISAAGIGRHPTEEARAAQIAAQLGHIVAEETRAKLRAANLGKKASEEARANMRAAAARRKERLKEAA